MSDPLINAVLDCEGLIYLRGGASDRSFWVALERDYALRAGKQVFALDTATFEDCPLPDFWLRFNEPSVQLYGDSTRSVTQRLDDLVVRLYWLIYRKTKVADREGYRLST